MSQETADWRQRVRECDAAKHAPEAAERLIREAEKAKTDERGR